MQADFATAELPQFSAVEQVHDGSELVQLSKDPLTQRSPEQHALVTEQCWPAPGQLLARQVPVVPPAGTLHAIPEQQSDVAVHAPPSD